MTKQALCYSLFPELWERSHLLSPEVSPMQRLQVSRPTDYARLRVESVRSAMFKRADPIGVQLMQTYVALADGASMLCGLSDHASGHFLSAVYCEA